MTHAKHELTHCPELGNQAMLPHQNKIIFRFIIISNEEPEAFQRYLATLNPCNQAPSHRMLVQLIIFDQKIKSKHQGRLQYNFTLYNYLIMH